jgi:hypothetical protein
VAAVEMRLVDGNLHLSLVFSGLLGALRASLQAKESGSRVTVVIDKEDVLAKLGACCCCLPALCIPYERKVLLTCLCLCFAGDLLKKQDLSRYVL